MCVCGGGGRGVQIGFYFPNKKIMYIHFISDIFQIINKNDINILMKTFSKQFSEITFITENVYIFSENFLLNIFIRIFIYIYIYILMNTHTHI